MSLVEWKSNPPSNIFAPNWSIKFWNEIILPEEVISEIKFTILKKEKDIIYKYRDTSNDGGTGLGPNSLTSKFSKFNILNWEYNWVDTIKKSTLSAIKNLCGNDMPDKIYSQCWANVMRFGDQIKPHWHSSYEHSFLGCHITISSENTKTYYENPYNKNNIYSVENTVGSMSIFPSYLVHWTDIHFGEKERITLAMDFLTEKAINSSSNNELGNFICIHNKY